MPKKLKFIKKPLGMAIRNRKIKDGMITVSGILFVNFVDFDLIAQNFVISHLFIKKVENRSNKLLLLF